MQHLNSYQDLDGHSVGVGEDEREREIPKYRTGEGEWGRKGELHVNERRNLERELERKSEVSKRGKRYREAQVKKRKEINMESGRGTHR